MDHHTLRTALVCCCKFLRQCMYFLRTLSRLSWLQWTLDDAKVSLTSRIFRIMVSFLSAQFRHKMFVKSEPSPRRWIYISFPVINSRFKQALVFFWPPDIVNFRLKSLLVIILVQVNKFNLPFRRRRNAHTYDCFGQDETDNFRHLTSKCHLTSCRSRHTSFLARNANENPSSATSRPLATSSLARPLRDLNNGRLAA